MQIAIIFIGVGLVIIFDAAFIGCWELTVGIGFIAFGLLCLFSGG